MKGLKISDGFVAAAAATKVAVVSFVAYHLAMPVVALVATALLIPLWLVPLLVAAGLIIAGKMALDRLAELQA